MRQPGLAPLLVLLAACGGSSSRQATPQPVATNSGAFAVVAVGDRLKAYVPDSGPSADGRFRLLVVDAAGTRSGASGHLGTVDLGTDGRASAVAASAGLVLAVGGADPYLWFIDPATDVVVKQLKLPDAYVSFILSDETAFMFGVAVDAARRRAYVSVWSGFIVLDLDLLQIVDEILVAPSENFGFDPQRNLLVAPFYLCPAPIAGAGTPPPCDAYRSPDGTLIAEGINLVDLGTLKVHTYVDAAAPFQDTPAGRVPDSAAVDPTGGRALIPLEGDYTTLLLDLDTAVLDDATGTFTVPDKVTLTVPTVLTAVAVEPGSRLGIGMEEFGSVITLYDLPSIAAGGVLTAATLPSLPWGVGEWSGHGDPHGLRAGVLDGRPVAWLLNFQRTWLARVDLEKLGALSRAHPGGVSSADMAQAVTYTFLYPAP